MAEDGEAGAVTGGTSAPSRVNTWDRPWSLKELRDEQSQWTLASDAGLLHFLEDFSSRLMSRTKDLENQVDSLVYDSISMEIKVHNTFNEFLMLSNTQFVENRVYEEDIEMAPEETPTQPTPSETPSQENLEAILVPKYTEAIALGMKALEQIQMDEDQEGDDDEAKDQEEGEIKESPTKKAKKEDFYSRRPLPAIIGTAPFNEDDNIGLSPFIDYSDSDEELQQDIVPEPPKEGEELSSDFDSESDSLESDIDLPSQNGEPKDSSSSDDEEEKGEEKTIASDEEQIAPKKEKKTSRKNSKAPQPKPSLFDTPDTLFSDEKDPFASDSMFDYKAPKHTLRIDDDSF
eukprot:TRINITY_DN5167_c0_g1_i1.p1 TRINITY_DN5167_c0_g1~~TRINITY_DN5167_c0_g1_i1.p1  ORF type:complete len:363 (-),score=130.82 TRINITY_DN5167_c0_g1_i1:118-1155(-)